MTVAWARTAIPLQFIASAAPPRTPAWRLRMFGLTINRRSFRPFRLFLALSAAQFV